VMNALDQPVLRVITFDGAGSDRRERGAAGRFSDGVRGWCGFGSLVPGGGTVYAHGEVVIRFAGFEFTGCVVGGHVPLAAHLVIDMLAILSGVGACARAHAELGGAHEARPFCVLEVRAEGVAVYESAYGVSSAVGAVRVQFTTLIPLLHINLSKIPNPSNLYVILSPNKMNPLQRPIRYNPSPSPALRAPSNLVLFRVADSTYFGWSPQAKVVCVVHPEGLAH